MDYTNGNTCRTLNNINGDVYVGSATSRLCRKMFDHKSICNTICNVNLSQLMRTIGRDNCYIELIETCPCNNKEELRAREGRYIRERSTLNQAIERRIQT